MNEALHILFIEMWKKSSQKMSKVELAHVEKSKLFGQASYVENEGERRR